MSLATTLYPSRRRIITSIQFNTVDPLVSTIPWATNVFIPDKPCKILSFRIKLHLFTLMRTNYDHRATTTYPKWTQGVHCYFQVYRGRYLTEPLLFPNPLNGQQWFLSPEDDLIDHGLLRVDTPANNQPPKQTINATGTLSVIGGAIVGPIVAPAGTGTVGPLSLDFEGAIDLNFDVQFPEFGGTTVDKYYNSGSLNIDMNGTGDFIQFTSNYFPILNDVNAGGRLEGTVELLIQY